MPIRNRLRLILASCGLAALLAAAAGLAVWFRTGNFPVTGAAAVWLVFTVIGLNRFGRPPKPTDPTMKRD